MDGRCMNRWMEGGWKLDEWRIKDNGGGWRDGWMDDGQMEGWTEGWMVVDGWRDGWRDGWMDARQLDGRRTE